MEDLNSKSTNDQLSASEWNGTRSEVQNIITNAGLTLSAGDQNQLGKAIADYVANADFFTDSGTANAHVLTAVSSNQSPTALKDGMRCRYRVNVTNTGATTVAVAGLTAKAVTINNVALAGGELVAGQMVTLAYHNSNGVFNIVAKEEAGGYVVNGYSLQVARYDGKSASVTSQAAEPRQFAFKDDGTKMFVLDNATDTIYQYSLTIPWVVSSASYDSISLSVTSEETSPDGLFFKDDGSKVYVLDSGSDTVYQYSLPTPWVLTSGSYDSISFSVTTQETSPSGMAFNSDGTKMYIIGIANDTVYQYSLPTAWVLTGMIYDGISFPIAGQGETVPRGMAFKADGGKMYVVGATNDSVDQYTTNFLST